MKKIRPYYDSDTWDLYSHPSEFVRNFFSKGKTSRTLSFASFKNTYLKAEAKEYLIYALEEQLPTYKNARTFARDLFLRWHWGLAYLSDLGPEVSDFVSEFETINARYVEYIKQHRGLSIAFGNTGTEYVPNNMLSGMHTYILRKKTTGPEAWQKLIWDRDKMPLTAERINPSMSFKRLDFSYIKDAGDLECVQLFMHHLVIDTNISFSTLYSYGASLKTFIRFQQQKGRTLKYANRDDIIEYYRDYGAQVSNNTFDGRVADCYYAYEYLCVYGLVSSNPFQLSDKHKDQYHYQLKTVDDETILKVFSVLHMIPRNLACMFLILYTTGMRVSEVCQIKNDCLFKNEKGYFLQFYCQKMKRQVMNPIPLSLYDRIKQIIEENAGLPYVEKYLFHSMPNHAYISNTFSSQLNVALEPYKIQKPDGTPFIFRPHDFRHTLATKMYRSNIDINVIQGILHHASIEMTMAYVERGETYMKEKSAHFLDYRGEPLDDKSESARISWMSENLKAQALPNGLCALPVKMGKCPHANACLDGCEFFRTSKDFLTQHRSFLMRLDAYIDLCAQNQWTTQQESAERVKKNVLEIIRNLEQQ